MVAQSQLSGVVLTEDNKGRLSPVAFASVYWLGTNVGTTTDTLGVFHLAKSETSNLLIISFVGFKSDTLEITSFKNSITVKLQKSLVLDAVEIEARQKARQMSFINPIQTELITERELFKAACCNLSESFETNPSVDVSFTDAVTGTKHIHMLGLAGKYAMISRENMTGVRVLGNSFGLSFIPGAWIESIQVSKGAGSVVNGYESMTGQINAELKKPDTGPYTFANVFANQGGRTEANLVKTIKVTEKVGTTLLMHANTRPFEQDRNKDGFLDFPLQDQINLLNRWKFKGDNGLMGQIGFWYTNDQKRGGQKEGISNFNPFTNSTQGRYRANIETERTEVFGKLGYLFPKLKYKSLGFLVSYVDHRQDVILGNRVMNSQQNSFYSNLIYQSIIGTSDHKFKTGLSIQSDVMKDEIDSFQFSPEEQIVGSFFEYTYTPNNNISIVAGLRADKSNYFDEFLTPRLHFRWAYSETAVFRLVAAQGRRTAYPYAENLSYFVSSRLLQLVNFDASLPYGFEQEVATNFGASLTKEFRLDYRDGSISLDFYRTDFQNKVVVDLDQSSDALLFYNLEGESYSNSLQAELSYELIKFLEMRMAYRYVDAKTEFSGVLRQNPFVPEHRGFVNLGYESAKSLKSSNWTFDFTWQWTGPQRLPSTADNIELNKRENQSPAFSMFNAQITRNFNKKWALYLGVENLSDFRQSQPIIDAANPFGNEFDASMVWGPIFGRMFYGGLRFQLEKK